jgi:hypothetical protein
VTPAFLHSNVLKEAARKRPVKKVMPQGKKRGHINDYYFPDLNDIYFYIYDFIKKSSLSICHLSPLKTEQINNQKEKNRTGRAAQAIRAPAYQGAAPEFNPHYLKKKKKKNKPTVT